MEDDRHIEMQDPVTEWDVEIAFIERQLPGLTGMRKSNVRNLCSDELGTHFSLAANGNPSFKLGIVTCTPKCKDSY